MLKTTGCVVERNFCAEPALLKRCILRSCRRVGLMRIVRPIVLPSSALMQALDAEIASRSAIGPEVVCDQPFRSEGIFPEKLP